MTLALTLDSDILQAYRKERREDPYTTARWALFQARAKCKPIRYEWHGRHDGGSYTTFEQEGFDIRIDVKPDEDNGADYTLSETPLRNGLFVDIRSWRLGQGAPKQWWLPESGEDVPTLATYYHKHGESKSVAWEHARASLHAEMEMDLTDHWSWWLIIATASVEGIELGSDILGGCQMEYDDRRQIEDILDSAGLIDEAIAQAKRNVKDVLGKLRSRLETLEAVAQED